MTDHKEEAEDMRGAAGMTKLEITGDESCYQAPTEMTPEEQANFETVKKEINEWTANLPKGVRFKGMQFLSHDGHVFDAQAITEDGTIYSDKSPEQRAAHNARVREQMTQWQEDNAGTYGHLYSVALRFKLLMRKLKRFFAGRSP